MCQQEPTQTSFKGRKSEREQLLNFVKENKKGYFCIVGHPGIGKSALMTEFIKDMGRHNKPDKVATIAYWIRRGTAQAQVDYFLNDLIKKTDDIFPQAKEIKSEGKTFFDLQEQLFSKWRLWGKQKSDTKLLVFIDGMDEGAENNIVEYLPRQLFENVLLGYSIRNESDRSSALESITIKLPKDEKIEEAFEIAQGIPDDITDNYGYLRKSRVLKSIAKELIKLGKYSFAKRVGFEISDLSFRHKIWKEITDILLKEIDWQQSFHAIAQFKQEETRVISFKAFVGGIDVVEVDNHFIQECLTFKLI